MPHKAMLDSHNFYLFIFIITEELRDMILLLFIIYILGIIAFHS